MVQPKIKAAAGHLIMLGSAFLPGNPPREVTEQVVGIRVQRVKARVLKEESHGRRECAQFPNKSDGPGYVPV